MQAPKKEKKEKKPKRKESKFGPEMGANHHFGEYSKMYAKAIKGITVIGLFNTWFCNGFPSLRDVVMGLYARYCDMIAESLKDRSAQIRQQAQEDAKQIFEFIL